MRLKRLRRLVCDLTALCNAGANEPAVLDCAGASLRDLISTDDWLPTEFAEPDPARYRQYLLYCDPLERFSIVSFVWGPGQRTAVHDHTVWGLIGMLRGSEIARNYTINPAGKLEPQDVVHLVRGQITTVSPQLGDIHQVENAFADRPSISIHAYGANIGAIPRHVYLLESGETKPYVSGYANNILPNLWDRSAETRSRLGI